MNDLLKRMNLENISDLFDECYKEALKDEALPVWLTEKYLFHAMSDCYISMDIYEILRPALSLIILNPDLVLFAKTLYHMLKIKKHFREVFSGLKLPKAPEDENPLPYDVFSFFPMLAHVHGAYLDLKKKGIPEDILKKTYSAFGDNFTNSTTIVGRPAFSLSYFLWSTTLKNASLFRIGRFDFEIRDNCNLKVRAFTNDKSEIKLLMTEGTKIHKSGLVSGSAGAIEEDKSFMTEYQETNEYYEGFSPDYETALVKNKKERLYKNEWKLLCGPGDNLISVHIPKGDSFSPDILDASFCEGRAFFKKYFSEIKFSGFMCISWLLSPELKSILKPDSNIISFQNRYVKYPVQSKGMDVFNFVFSTSVSFCEKIDFESLPEKTSMQRNLKKLYKNGNFIHETGGIFLF